MQPPRQWEQVFGRELREGDVIKTWFSQGQDRIVCLTPYSGPLAHLFPGGASIASFAISNTGMTIDHSDVFERATISRSH